MCIVSGTIALFGCSLNENRAQQCNGRSQTVRPCVARAGRMLLLLLLRETTSCSLAVTVEVEPPHTPTDEDLLPRREEK